MTADRIAAPEWWSDKAWMVVVAVLVAALWLLKDKAGLLVTALIVGGIVAAVVLLGPHVNGAPGTVRVP